MSGCTGLHGNNATLRKLLDFIEQLLSLNLSALGDRAILGEYTNLKNRFGDIDTNDFNVHDGCSSQELSGNLILAH